MCPLQDLLGWTKDKSEVEIVDLVLKLREKLVSEGRSPLITDTGLNPQSVDHSADFILNIISSSSDVNVH